MTVCAIDYNSTCKKTRKACADELEGPDLCLPVHADIKALIGDIDDPRPGVDIDPLSRLLYLRCNTHFIEHEVMRSNQCTVTKCKQRFRTEGMLLNHMEEAHGKILCKLCVEHRPLFINEHQTFSNQKQLRHHTLQDPNKGSGEINSVVIQSVDFARSTFLMPMNFISTW